MIKACADSGPHDPAVDSFARADGERFGLNVVFLVKHNGCIVWSVRSDSRSVRQSSNLSFKFWARRQDWFTPRAGSCS